LTTAVDTSVVIAWQNPRHVFHERAVQLIAQAIPPLYLSELNLAEFLVGLNQSEWDAATRTLTAMGFNFLNPSGTEVAAARLDGKLRMPDACVLATARMARADTLLTFDDALAAAATKLGLATG
jgi:predicted nucleic acid-binding protein